jgi:asparagine synthase (glutamine-hydrolysing)
MCGIAGILSVSSSGPRDLERALAAMVQSMDHRGPDAVGVWRVATEDGGAIRLGHSRLKVIDLSSAGSQPMTRDSLTVTYNGELTNYRELREELAAAGARFTTASDTEVLLAAWKQWGPQAIDRIDGMFAFALWDGAEQRLWLARDRFGIKPLYFASTVTTMAFASELRALLASGLVEPQLDERSLAHYLAYQTAPTPNTMIQDVRMIEPGHLMSVTTDGKMAAQRYWSLLEAAAAIPAVASADEAQQTTAALLDRAVRSHLAADVPLGMFLSGGIDSGALLSVLSETAAQARTFTVTLTGPSDADESAEARHTAKTFGSDHTEIQLSGDDMAAQLPDALAALDHPSADGMNTYIISRAVRARGITVALSGLGGDELFGGYPSFNRLAKVAPAARHLGRSPAAFKRATARALRSAGGGRTVLDKAATMIEGSGSVAELWPITRELFGSQDRERLLGAAAHRFPDACVALLAHAFHEWPHADLFAQVSFAESRLYMHDVLLRDADQMSMAHGLEVRLPLLDHRLAAFVVSLPAHMKRNGPKSLLVNSLRRPLPAGLVGRRKRGFTLPFDGWMRGPLRSFCEAQLGDRGLERRDLFQPGVVADVWSRFLAGSASVTWPRVWSLVALNAWLDRLHVRTS